MWRPGHLMHHSITLLLHQITLTQPRGVLGHCPVDKQIIVPLRTNQMGWHITRNAVVAMLVKCALNSKSTPSPSHLLLHASRWEPHMRRSSVHLLCVSQIWTNFHQSNVHYACFLAQASLFFLLVSFRGGFFAAF